MTNAHRDLATPEPWARSLERSRRRRALLPKARRESRRKKHVSAALATAVVAGPATPLAAAQVTSGDVSAAVAAESPANRAIEIREGGLPLRVGSQGDLVVQVQRELHVDADGIFGPQTDAAVRSYQQAKGLDVDGIVGLATWGSLFPGQTHATATGAAIGGSNIPAAAQGKVEQTLQVAGNQLALQGDAGYSGTTSVGTTGIGTPGTTGTTGTGAPATTPVANPAPGTTTVSGCGSSTIVRPVSGPVTSPFGPRGGRNHDGMDIGAATGTPVRAAACGTVSLAGQQSGYGNIVCITHTSQFSTCYAHLSRFGTSAGAHVQQGQVIGYVGCTGNCTGPHLHFETRVGGVARDPSQYLGGASMPGATASATKASASSSSQTQFGIGGGTSSTNDQTTATMLTPSGQPTGTAPAEQPADSAAQPEAAQPEDTLSASEIAAEVAPPGTVPASTAPAEQDQAAAPATSTDGTVTTTDGTVTTTDGTVTTGAETGTVSDGTVPGTGGTDGTDGTVTGTVPTAEAPVSGAPAATTTAPATATAPATSSTTTTTPGTSATTTVAATPAAPATAAPAPAAPAPTTTAPAAPATTAPAAPAPAAPAPATTAAAPDATVTASAGSGTAGDATATASAGTGADVSGGAAATAGGVAADTSGETDSGVAGQ
jgi:murein DD-endopeptidase MepM/ murein hydrolase activator NlpD